MRKVVSKHYDDLTTYKQNQTDDLLTFKKEI